MTIGLVIISTSFAEPVITVDKERIISISKEEISNRYPDINVDSLQLTELVYKISSTAGESMQINFQLTDAQAEITEEQIENGTKKSQR